VVLSELVRVGVRGSDLLKDAAVEIAEGNSVALL
jgi:hypothetical protein